MINNFKRPYSFLSNFSKVDIEYEGIPYQSVESAYQASKCLDPEEKQKFSRCSNPFIAKQMGKRVKMVEDWEDIKLDVMRDLLRLKFQNPKMRDRLVSTGDEYLVEGNSWHDNYWGVCSCENCRKLEQHNHLGILLMEIRDEVS